MDLAVAVGLPRASRYSVAAFYIAALSQIGLYALGRAWVLDVPPEFAPAPDQIAYLDLLVGFHIATIVLVAAALVVRRR